MYMSVCGHPFFNRILYAFLNANSNKECIMHFHIHIVSFYRLLDLLKSADDVTVYCAEKNPWVSALEGVLCTQWLAYAHILIFSMQHNLETVCEDCKYSCLYLSWWYYSQHHLQRSQGQNFKQFREGEPVKHVSTCWRITYIIFISFNMQCTELIAICWFNLGASNVD